MNKESIISSDILNKEKSLERQETWISNSRNLLKTSQHDNLYIKSISLKQFSFFE